MKINKNDSNPATRCTYLFDAVGMTPAAMNYSAGRFDFGDWGNVFFVKNNYPAMVKYDGSMTDEWMIWSMQEKQSRRLKPMKKTEFFRDKS